MMNFKLIRSIFIFSAIYILPGCSGNDNINMYLGQEPPEAIPELFAPGIVSTEEDHEFSGTFSPDGEEFYFNRYMQIMVCRWTEKGWTDPEPVKFTGNYRSHEPYISHDNKYLYYGSMRPNPDFPDEEEPGGIWRVERTGQGWSEPSYVGFGMYVTMTSNNIIYLTDRRGESSLEQGIAKTTLINNQFGELIRQQGGVVNPAEDRRPGRHPFISPDESFIIFDSYEMESGKNGKLFLCFKQSDNLWGNAIRLNDKINKGNSILAPYISPDGKYLFYTSDGDIYWVSTSFLDGLKNE